MAIDAKLSLEGRNYDVVECEYEFTQAIKENRLPARLGPVIRVDDVVGLLVEAEPPRTVASVIQAAETSTSGSAAPRPG